MDGLNEQIGAKKKQGADSEDVVLDDATDQAATTTAGQIAQAKTKVRSARVLCSHRWETVILTHGGVSGLYVFVCVF